MEMKYILDSMKEDKKQETRKSGKVDEEIEADSISFELYRLIYKYTISSRNNLSRLSQ